VFRWLGYGLIAIGFTAGASWLYLFIFFANTRPHEPHPEADRTIVLNNHGGVAYLTEAEDLLLTWLSYGAVISGAIGGLLLSKRRK
jgi:hypothetical protein